MDGFFKEHAVHFGITDPRMDDLENNLNNIIDYTKFSSKAKWNNVLFPKWRLELPEIKKIYFNKPYTIVIWGNGEKTIVKCAEGDTYSKEMGVLLAIRKYEMGNESGAYFRSLEKLIKEKGVENDGKKKSD